MPDNDPATTTHDPRELLTPTVAAKLLGVTTDSLRRAAIDRRISFFRTPGNHRRFLAADVLEYRAKCYVPAIVFPSAPAELAADTNDDNDDDIR